MSESEGISHNNGSSSFDYRSKEYIETLRTVFKAYISERGLSRQHIDSFNAFVKERLKKIVESIGEIKITVAPSKKSLPDVFYGIPHEVKIRFGNVRIGRPMTKEKDEMVREITPLEARLRNLSYTAPLEVEMIYEDENGEERRWVKLADFPVMVRSSIDPLSKMSREELLAIGEDPDDPGGYFIINGSEKVVVIQEDLAVNRIIVGKPRQGTKATHTAKVVSTRLGIRRQVIVDLSTDGTLEVRTARLASRVPFVILMRALGFERDQDIMLAVSADPDVQRELWPSLMKVSTIARTREDALDYIGNRVASGQPREIRIRRAEEFLDREFLPHLGSRPEDRIKKALFLAEMANRVIQYALGKREEDDKDNYSNKRLRLAGDLIAELFRDALEAVVRNLRQKLEESLAQRRRVNPFLLVRSDIITDRLRSALATGNWGQDRTGVSQQLDRTNWVSLLSHLRRVVSPLSKGQAHFEARDLHGTHWGRLCPFETPEGVNCGLVKNLALLSYITVGVDESEIEKLLVEELGVRRIEDLLKEARETGEVPEIMINGAKVFLNGKPLGYHHDGAWLARKIRELRRQGKISHEVSVAHIVTEYLNEVYINTDEGRVMRPVIIVENGKPKLTPEHAKMLEEGKITFMDLVKMGVIEFLDPDEEENAYIAPTPDKLTPEHTHLELWPPGILGVSASTIPYLEHNQSPRNTYQSAMAKQALGLYALNYHFRMDSHSYLLHYPQKPLVQTLGLELIGYNKRPSGQNMVIAIMAFTGYNIEDAIIFNRFSADRGLARATFFRVYTATESIYPGAISDKIMVPPPGLHDHKGEQYYTKLAPDGIVDPEVEVTGGDVLVGRVSPPRFLGGESRIMSRTAFTTRRDTSIQLRYGEKGVVDFVMITQTRAKQKIVKVRVRDLRIPEIGDKFASRHGQKGVIGMILPAYDMPYTEEGITPDIILNPHAIPSRMTIGQLLEALAGKLAALEARFVDGTPFFKEDIDGIRLSLIKHGYDPNAREVMYDGRTGELIERPITIGIVFYQRLYHMVADKIHARATGKVQLLTRQPTEGRAVQGGLRFGEMERDCLIGHGSSMLLRDRMLDNSDAYIMYVCRKCGHIAWFNRRAGAFECPYHGFDGDVVPVKVPYAFKLLLQEITSMVIKPEIKVADKISLLRKRTGRLPVGLRAAAHASGGDSSDGSESGGAGGK